MVWAGFLDRQIPDFALGDKIQFNTTYGFMRARMLEGTFPGNPETGTGAVTSNRVLRMYGALPTEVWSVPPKPWPPMLPNPALQLQALMYRIRSYHRVTDLDAARLALTDRPFVTTVPITRQWMIADRGRIETPQRWDEIIDRHAICILGYDDEARSFVFWNCWGPDWGDRGHGYLPYDYWIKFQLDSWFQLGQYEFFRLWFHPPRAKGLVEFIWTRPVRGGFVHGVELWTEDGSIDLGWAFFVHDDVYVHVHELFVRPEFRRRGYGRLLVKRLEHFASGRLIPQFWLSHIDNAELGPNKLDLAFNLGYRIEESGVPWAAKLLVPRTQPHVDRPQSPGLQYGSCAAAAISQLVVPQDTMVTGGSPVRAI